MKDDLVNEGGIMDSGGRGKRAFSNTARGSAPTSARCELKTNGFQRRGSIQRIMSLPQSRRSQRRCHQVRRHNPPGAKMVCLDVNHPDIETFVKWKVVEEQKVANLVTGSQLNQKHLNAIMRACYTDSETGEVTEVQPQSPTRAETPG